MALKFTSMVGGRAQGKSPPLKVSPGMEVSCRTFKGKEFYLQL